MLEEEDSIFMCFFSLLLTNKNDRIWGFNLCKSLDSLKLLEQLKIKVLESGTV